MIDTCVNYSTKWHFKFNAAKSKCMTIGKYFNEDHTRHLGPNIQLVNGNSLDILGVSYNADGTNVTFGVCIYSLAGLLIAIRLWVCL